MTPQAVPQKWNSPAPMVAIVPGLVVTAVGLWALLHGDVSLLAAVALPAGISALLLGVVAKGVEWGINIQQQQRERIPG